MCFVYLLSHKLVDVFISGKEIIPAQPSLIPQSPNFLRGLTRKKGWIFFKDMTMMKYTDMSAELCF